MLWIIYQTYVDSFNEKEMTIPHAYEAIRTIIKWSGFVGQIYEELRRH
jgi:hypothetical protein